MKLPPLKKQALKISGGLLLGLSTLTASALSTDANQLAQFAAKNVAFNEKTGITIFTGNVTMDQGTTHLTGDQVTSYKDNTGKTYKIIATGNLAHYQTLPDGQKLVVNAFAKTIQYFPQKSIAILIDQAEVIQGPNIFKGPHIVYDIKKQVVVSSSANKALRSVIIIEPQSSPAQNSTAKSNTAP